MTTGNSLLFVIPSVVLSDGNSFRVDGDFFNNLRVYRQNFDEIVFACPAMTASQNEGYVQRSIPINELPSDVRYVELPYTYREDTHLRHYFRTRRLLRQLIHAADYLLFAPHAPFDWATVAAREAIKAGRKYDVDFAVDYDKFLGFKAEAMPNGPRKIRSALLRRWMRREFRRSLSNSAVAMLMGKEVFDTFKQFAPNPQTMLNVQVRAGDHISDTKLDEKLAEIRSGAPLRIVYSGNMTDRKGASDWVKAIKGSGCEVSATWFGDGPERESMEGLANGLPINLPGVFPRNEVLAAMRDAHMFLFCHKVPEAPRCLVEALACGAPLVGYWSSYPEGLTENGGGEFVATGDWRALGALIAELDKDRSRLANLVTAAASTGRRFEHDIAVQHRVDMIKKYVSN